MIPKSKRFNSLLIEKFLSHFVALQTFGQTVLEAVQFNRQLRVRTVKVQDVFTDQMLPTKFETGKASSSKFTPEFLFIIRLIVSQLPGDLFQAHAGEIASPAKHRKRIERHLPLLAKRGEGWGEVKNILQFQSPSPRSSPRLQGEEEDFQTYPRGPQFLVIGAVIFCGVTLRRGGVDDGSISGSFFELACHAFC